MFNHVRISLTTYSYHYPVFIFKDSSWIANHTLTTFNGCKCDSQIICEFSNVQKQLFRRITVLPWQEVLCCSGSSCAKWILNRNKCKSLFVSMAKVVLRWREVSEHGVQLRLFWTLNWTAIMFSADLALCCDRYSRISYKFLFRNLWLYPT